MQVCNRENPEIRVCKAHRPLEENDHFRKTEKLFKYFKPHRMGKRKIIPNETDFSTCIHPLTTPSEFIESKPGVFHHKELNGLYRVCSFSCIFDLICRFAQSGTIADVRLLSID